MTVATASLLLSLLLVGCGSDGSNQASTPTATSGASTSPAPAAQTYNSPTDIITRLSEAGLDCGEVTLVNEPQDAAARATCGEHVSVGIYADSASAKGQFDREGAMGQGFDIPVHLLVGENWTVSGEPDYLQKAKQVLGGEISTYTG